MLFGEWCYAVHTVRYTSLPDWFLMFDVYDRRAKKFWSVKRRDQLARRLDLATVPLLGSGRYTLSSLKRLLARSKLSDGPPEGLYVRHDAGDWLTARAKLVRPEFAEQITEHWSRRRLERNGRVGKA